MDYKIISNYQHNKLLRDSFNELSKKVFGLDFEGWYQNGFWNDNYIPYSIVVNDKVISNVSVNVCNFLFKGKEVHLIQLGTIMSDPEYRGKGLASKIIDAIIHEFENKVDGIYLFANDSVTDFYPKIGFSKQKEFQYSKEVSFSNERSIVSFPMKNKENWAKFVKIIEKYRQFSDFYMFNNSDLYMFYLTQFMQESVYYIKEKDTYVIAEEENELLKIHAVFGECDIDDVIKSFGSRVKNVTLCFTPKDKTGYKIEEFHEEDTTLFVRGKFFEKFKLEKLIFPSLSHA